jgi:hypothetical protein
MNTVVTFFDMAVRSLKSLGLYAMPTAYKHPIAGQMNIESLASVIRTKEDRKLVSRVHKVINGQDSGGRRKVDRAALAKAMDARSRAIETRFYRLCGVRTELNKYVDAQKIRALIKAAKKAQASGKSSKRVKKDVVKKAIEHGLEESKTLHKFIRDL